MRGWQKRVSIWFLVALLLVSLVSISCGDDGGGDEETGTIKVGLITSLSGPASQWGVPVRNAILLRIDQINMEGGVTVDGKTYLIDVVTQDDGYSTEKAVAAINELISHDKVKYIMGSFGSGPCLAEAPIAQENGVLFIAGGKSGGITTPELDLVFQPFTTSDISCPMYWKWVSDNVPEAQKIAIIYPDNATGAGVSANAEKAIEFYGLDLVSKKSFPTTTTDFYPILTPLLETDPDWIDLAGPTETLAGLIMKQARELGYEGRFGSTSWYSSTPIVDAAGEEAAEGLISTSPITEGEYAIQGLKSFKEAYVSRYGQWDEVAGGAPDWATLISYGMEVSNSLDPVEIKNGLEAQDKLELPLGTSYWTGEQLTGISHQFISTVSISQMQDGLFVGIGEVTAAEGVTIIDDYYKD